MESKIVVTVLVGLVVLLAVFMAGYSSADTGYSIFDIFKRTSAPAQSTTTSSGSGSGGGCGNGFCSNTERNSGSCPQDCNPTPVITNCTGTLNVLITSSRLNNLELDDGYDVNYIELSGTNPHKALFTVDGTFNSIDEGKIERINGVDIYLVDVYTDNDPTKPTLFGPNTATFVVCGYETCTGQKVLLRINDTVDYEDSLGRVFNIKLDGLDDDGVLLRVEYGDYGAIGKVHEDSKENMNGLFLYVNSVFNSDDDTNDQALITFCNDYASF